MHTLRVPDYPTLSRKAAGAVAEAIHSKNDLRLGLPTGATPVGMYQELVHCHHVDGLDFSHVRAFNLDEYLGLPVDHPKTFHSYMRRHFFDHVNIAPENIRIPNSTPEDEQTEAEAYEQAIEEAGGIDVLIVGIGTNGHIAFNEPRSSFSSRTRSVDLAPETRLNAARNFANEEEVPHRAITVGIATILEAKRILLLASGTGKARALQLALHGPIGESLPASALRLHADVTVIADEAALGNCSGGLTSV